MTRVVQTAGHFSKALDEQQWRSDASPAAAIRGRHQHARPSYKFSAIRWNVLTWHFVFGMLGAVGAALALPSEIDGIQLEQQIDYTPRCDLLRIWIVYIGQGDAILIQIPERFAADGAAADGVVDVLVDGGPSGKQLQVFLKALYPQPTTIENVVLSHHDSDHVRGLTGLLKSPHFTVRDIYHNGLASWRLGGRGFAVDDWPARSKAVYDSRKTKGMALLEDDELTLESGSLVQNLADLRAAGPADFVGVYKDFAEAVLGQSPPVATFLRTHENSDDAFVPDVRGESDCAPLRFDALWPQEQPQRFGGWSYTINGNSVTFKLTYRDFSMLFAGDHNEDSEAVMLGDLQARGEADRIRGDVLKISHHGSQHNLQGYFEAIDPTVSIASMGKRGFALSWKHPSTEVIEWVGGPSRAYHTYIHERDFSWPDMEDPDARDEMVERKHVLVETDGTCFRVAEFLEVPDLSSNLPSVRQTDDGDGTRWICHGD